MIQNTGGRSYNYEEKYGPDPLGDEIKENARVWKVYLDEAESYDDEMLRGFRDTIDSLLVFVSIVPPLKSGYILTLPRLPSSPEWLLHLLLQL